MTTPAVISAQVVDIQNDRAHKGSIKITLHIPAEAGAHLTDVLGWPTYTNPVPVALARLVEQKEIAQQSPPSSPTPTKAGTRIPVAIEKRLAAKAGMLCSDPEFLLYLAYIGGPPNKNEEEAALYVRAFCGVNSRSEIVPGSKAAAAFERLLTDFTLYRDADKFVEASA
jgi:hypothetical protein